MPLEGLSLEHNAKIKTADLCKMTGLRELSVRENFTITPAGITGLPLLKTLYAYETRLIRSEPEYYKIVVTDDDEGIESDWDMDNNRGKRYRTYTIIMADSGNRIDIRWNGQPKFSCKYYQ